jgi:hypothetical protein
MRQRLAEAFTLSASSASDYFRVGVKQYDSAISGALGRAPERILELMDSLVHRRYIVGYAHVGSLETTRIRGLI